MNYFISDTHFGHSRIIELCNRPFQNKDEMDAVMIKNWNSVVNHDDTVFHLGDFMFYKKDTGIFNSLNGRKILIQGNHDHTATRNLGWECVRNYIELDHKGNKVVLFHYPLADWNKRFHGSYHLHGHVHTTFENEPIVKNRFNISIEYMDYRPQTLEEILGE